MVQKKRGLRKDGLPNPELYDFRSPMKLPREYGRILEMAFGSFARAWSNQLVVRLRVMSAVTLRSTEMRSYGSYIADIPTTTTAITVSVAGGRGIGMIEIPLATTLSWVDRMLGGAGKIADAVERELTEIELSLLKELLGRSFADLTTAFAGLLDLSVTYKGIDYNPQFIQAMENSAPVLIGNFDIEVEEEHSKVTVMLPAPLMLDALRDGERLDSRTEDQLATQRELTARIMASLTDTPMQLRVQFSASVHTVRDLDRLQVGDTVPLYHPVTRPLDIKIDDMTWAKAAAGTSGSRLAAMVVSIPERERE